MSIDTIGPDFEFAANSRYLLDALKNVNSMDALFKIGNENRPFVIKDQIGDFFTVIMPMALA
jgi:DNA polymerase III sliding clamp (beta) subunit (PCNA family)